MSNQQVYTTINEQQTIRKNERNKLKILLFVWACIGFALLTGIG